MAARYMAKAKGSRLKAKIGKGEKPARGLAREARGGKRELPPGRSTGHGQFLDARTVSAAARLRSRSDTVKVGVGFNPRKTRNKMGLRRVSNA